MKPTNESLTSDVLYFKNKRDAILDRFCSQVKSGESLDIIEKKYNSLIRVQKQLMLMEDAILIHRLHKRGILNQINKQIIEQSEYIHDFLINKDDIKGLGKDWLIGLDSEKVGMLMHLYIAPQIIEVKKKDNFKDDMAKRLKKLKKLRRKIK